MPTAPPPPMRRASATPARRAGWRRRMASASASDLIAVSFDGPRAGRCAAIIRAANDLDRRMCGAHGARDASARALTAGAAIVRRLAPRRSVPRSPVERLVRSRESTRLEEEAMEKHDSPSWCTAAAAPRPPDSQATDRTRRRSRASPGSPKLFRNPARLSRALPAHLRCTAALDRAGGSRARVRRRPCNALRISHDQLRFRPAAGRSA
mgnify:CR=1 FL=1